MKLNLYVFIYKITQNADQRESGGFVRTYHREVCFKISFFNISVQAVCCSYVCFCGILLT